MGELNKDKAVDLLNRILEQELAGDVDKMLRQPGEVAAFRPGAANPE